MPIPKEFREMIGRPDLVDWPLVERAFDDFELLSLEEQLVVGLIYGIGKYAECRNLNHPHVTVIPPRDAPV